MIAGEKIVEPGSARPLVAAAALLLLGMALGRMLAGGAQWVVWGAAGLWCGWLITETMHWRKAATLCLAGAIFLAGAGVWILNQEYGEGMQVARFAAGMTDGRHSEEIAVSLRMAVLATSGAQGADEHGDGLWVGRAREILTDHGWMPAAGDLLVRWRGGQGGKLRRGELVEVYGWLSAPDGVMNPGGIDRRKMLAADRVFGELRVPRASGVVVLDDRNAMGDAWLGRMRLFLRSKLLEPLVQADVPAAYTMTALLLGTRDPAIADVSQAFADAGVAHLLAISGLHVVFFAGLAWFVLRLIPMRPRGRELVVACVVIAYVIATPCGPPIVRAAVALVMVLLGRLAGRPREYLNMLAAAAIVVVMIRPADIATAGFQLSFVSTAGLILFAPRLYQGLFGKWLEREEMVAELADTAWARRRITLYRWGCGLLVGNAIGSVTAAPLVALHFGQANLWAMAAGVIALPVVGTAMVVGAVQLCLSVLWSGAATALAPLTAAAGRVMIWVVEHLAKLPGAAVALRPPPAWVVVGFYVVLALWAVRRRLGISRAMIVNALIAMAAATAAWYAWTAPVAQLRLMVLDTGNSTSLLMRTPSGDLWAIDAGAPRTSSVQAVLSPALRLEGTRRLDALLLTELDAAHASAAGEAVETYHPRIVMASAASWEKHGQTLAGESLAQATGAAGVPVRTLHAAQRLEIGRNGKRTAEAEVLWPPANGNLLERRDLILNLSYAGREILVLDPAAVRALALVMLARPDLRCDVVILLGVQRGAGDETLRQVIGPLGAQQIIWSGRGPWAQKREAPGEFNTAAGAVELVIDSTGDITVR